MKVFRVEDSLKLDQYTGLHILRSLKHILKFSDEQVKFDLILKIPPCLKPNHLTYFNDELVLVHIMYICIHVG